MIFISMLNNIPIKWNYKSRKIENWFQSEIFTYLRKRDYFCYHPADIWYGTKLLDSIIISPEGKVFFIEFKKVMWYTFNMSQFEPSQIDVLELMLDRWVEVYIMVFSVKTNTYWVGTYQYLKANANELLWVKLFSPKEKSI